MEQVNLLYCGNDDAYEGILLSLLSVMEHTQRSLCVRIFTACLDIPCGKPIESSRIKLLNRLLADRKDGSFAVLLDVTEIYGKVFKDCTYQAKNSSFTPYALLRLLADRVYEGGRVIYLDADTMAAGDIGTLFDEELNGCALGGVRDMLGSLFLAPDYINSGVLLIDINGVKRERAFRKAIDFLQREKLYFPDQSSLNYSDISICVLPQRYNEQRRIKRDTVIRHFCRCFKPFPYPHIDRRKPWQHGGLRGKERVVFKNCFEEFLLQSSDWCLKNSGTGI